MSQSPDSLPPNSIDAVALANVGRLEQSNRLSQARVTRILLVLTLVLTCVVATGLVLRLAVSMFGETKVNTFEIDELRPVSRLSNARSAEREIVNELIRENARRFDKRLLEQHRDRTWVYETRVLPDARDAKAVWQREVESIEKQLAEAKSLQEKIDSEAPGEVPDAVAEGSVLWHRMKFLEELREDAPADH